MENKVYLPHPFLQDFILSFATVDITLPAEIPYAVNPYPPTPHQSIIFYGGATIEMSKHGCSHFSQQAPAVVIGPQFTPVRIRVHRQLKAVRVDFQPGGLFQLLGIPLQELFDQGIDSRDIAGAEMHYLNEALTELPCMEARKCRVEQYFLRKAASLKDVLPIDRAMRELLRHGGNISIGEVAAMACLSLRQFERKCLERVGIAPKTFARIARFSKAYRLKEAQPDLTWTSIAYEAGYFDQMHFIRDFKQFAGVQPRVIEKELSATPIRMQAHLRP